jgi:putative transposase
VGVDGLGAGVEGELLKLGHRVAPRRSAGSCSAHRIPPASARHTDTSWRQFLRTQAASMLAVGFFHVHIALTLRRLYLLFPLEVGDRYLQILRVTGHPDGPWTTQQARNLVMQLGDCAARFRFLVRDRAGQFTAAFDAVLADAGIEVVKITPRYPRSLRDRDERPRCGRSRCGVGGRQLPPRPHQGGPQRQPGHSSG